VRLIFRLSVQTRQTDKSSVKMNFGRVHTTPVSFPKRQIRYGMYKFQKLRETTSLRCNNSSENTGLKIYFTGPSDKMSDDVEFGSDICPMTFSSVLTRK
jgi:hypothetical protein